MSYFYLPKIYPCVTIENIELRFGKDEKNENYLDGLKNIKDEIKKYDGHKVIQKLLTPYSLLNSIVKDKSLSNEYLLFNEIFNLSKIIIERSIISFHFSKNCSDIVKSLLHIRNNDNDIHYLMNNNNLPQTKTDKNINNNILNESVYRNIINNYKNKFDLITIMECDNYDNKGNNIYLLKVLLSIYMLKSDSNLIFRIPNLYESQNIEMLYFISNYFERTIIIKPNINNYFDNNKYISCKNLMNNQNKDFIKYICENFYTFYRKDDTKYRLFKFLKLNIPTTFLSKVEECNSITAQSLIDNYCYLHNICKINENNPCNKKLSEINEKNKQKCINWCITNGFEHIE